MIANPFTYGNPISDPARFFGREREVEQVYTRLRNTEFESSSIVGERRIGKTSLLNYLAHPDVAQRHGLDPQQVIFVYVDLQMVDSATTPTRLWGRLLRQMKRQFENAELQEMAEETRKSEVIDTFALADLFDVVDEKELYVVLLLDEFENVTNNQNFGTDFFYGLRSLAIHHNLALVTSSRQELIELCHSDAVRASPFFNIFANINLRVFTPQEARKLIDESLAGAGTTFQEAEIERIFRIAGYHPYFLQAACHFLFEAYNQGLRPAERRSFAVNEFKEEAAPHFAHYWHDSDDGEKAVLAVLAMLEEVRTPEGRAWGVDRLQELSSRSELTLVALEKRGLAVRDGAYRLFSTAFADWILTEMTDTAGDDVPYEEWLDKNEALLDRVGRRARGTVEQLLPQIKGAYRGLLINWFSDPRIAEEAAPLLLDALEYHQQQWLREHEEAVAPPAPAQRYMAYCNFDLAIDNCTHRGYPIRARSEMGEARAVMALDPASTEMVEALGKLAADDVNEDYLSRTGARLYENLLSGDVGALFEATVGRATAREEGVRIRLTIQPPEMAALPWELLCSRTNGDFLATSTKTLLARYVEVQMPLRDLRVSPPVKMLGIIPWGSGLDVGAEKMVLQEALGKLGGAVGFAPPPTGRGASGAVQLTWLEGTVTTTRISDALLEDGYHIVHYIGHGVFERDQGYLMINDEAGREHPINERQFARLFLNYPSVKLIVLNACQGAAVSATRPFVGIAPQLVRRGIPAVIAMQYPVYDDVALRFAREFYRCLCMGAAAGQVDAAVSHARNQLCIHFPNERAVATPVLFLRAPDGVIFDLS